MTGRRKAPGGLLIGLGLMMATLAWVALSIQLTILDADRFAGSASALLETDQVRDRLSGKLEDALVEVLPPGTSPPQLKTAAQATLGDPLFVSAFEGALITLHERAFRGTDSALVLDGGRVGAAGRSALESVDPGLAQQLPPGTRLDVSLADSDDVPDLSRVDTTVTLATLLALIGAAVMLAGGVALTRDRPRALARLGRWAVVLAGAQLLAALALPWLFRSLALGGWPEVGVRSWQALAAGLVLPAILLSAGGVGLLGGARRLRRSGTLMRGPAAAPVPPPAAGATPSPSPPTLDTDSARERVRGWVWPES